MIKSISFPSEGTGYIYEKTEKPICPKKSDYKQRYGQYHFRGTILEKEDGEWLERYNADMAEYRKENAWYKKHKDEYVVGQCALNLIGKTFNFEQDKVNIIFGPNGSGKSTIIKGIAGLCGCKDGFTSLFDPMEIRHAFDTPITVDVFEKALNRGARNSCSIEWDGVLVYYDNFKETETHSYGQAGNLVGSIFNNIAEEVFYIMDRNKVSSGQKNMWLMSKLLKIAKEKRSLKSLIDPKLQEAIRMGNCVWQACYLAQYMYWQQFPKFAVDSAPTILFDEIDSSLDIERIWSLHYDFLPKFVKDYGCQIILVSHSPLVLTNDIMGDRDRFNVISIDEEYTRAVKQKLSGVRF